MSRIGKKQINIPQGVTVQIKDIDPEKNTREVLITGSKGINSVFVPQEISVEIEGDVLRCSPVGSNDKVSALWGLSRALLAGAIVGVTQGFMKKLEIEGIGYRANIEGTTLVLSLGFSHTVRVEPPAGITFSTEKNSIIVSGIDKQMVGQMAAQIRSFKKPEPYKGKGIRYAGEVVRRKAGKKAAVAAK